MYLGGGAGRGWGEEGERPHGKMEEEEEEYGKMDEEP